MKLDEKKADAPNLCVLESMFLESNKSGTCYAHTSYESLFSSMSRWDDAALIRIAPVINVRLVYLIIISIILVEYLAAKFRTTSRNDRGLFCRGSAQS